MYNERTCSVATSPREGERIAGTFWAVPHRGRREQLGMQASLLRFGWRLSPQHGPTRERLPAVPPRVRRAQLENTRPLRPLQAFPIARPTPHAPDRPAPAPHPRCALVRSRNARSSPGADVTACPAVEDLGEHGETRHDRLRRVPERPTHRDRKDRVQLLAATLHGLLRALRGLLAGPPSPQAVAPSLKGPACAPRCARARARACCCAQQLRRADAASRRLWGRLEVSPPSCSSNSTRLGQLPLLLEPSSCSDGIRLGSRGFRSRGFRSRGFRSRGFRSRGFRSRGFRSNGHGHCCRVARSC